MGDTTRFWIGASTLGTLGSAAQGIRPLDVAADGSTQLGDAIDVGENPQYVAASSDGTLGIVHEAATGRVSTWRGTHGESAANTTSLVPHGRPGAASGDPCHLTFDPTGRWLIAANYSGGALTLHPVEADAAADAIATASFDGTGPNTERQQSSHLHQAVVDTARRRVLGPDLGADRVRVVSLAAPRSLPHDATADIVVHPGAGPRHLVITGDLAIVANELDRTASVLDLEAGVEAAWFSVGDDVEPRGLGVSAIRLTSTGIVLIGDRDAGAVRALRLDADAQTLELVATVTTGGEHPRDLQITRDERHVLVADQQSDSIAVIALDDTGIPTRVVETLSTPAPTCLCRVG